MAKIPPGTVSIQEAADQIGCHCATVRAMVLRGVFSVIRPLGTGHGRRVYIPSEEVMAFQHGAEDAVRELRERSKQAATAIA